MSGFQLRPQTRSAAIADKTSKRRKLWDLRGGFQCSIVGTCFSQDDLIRLAPKCGVRIAVNAPEYDVHSYFVQHACSPGPVARALNKLLDQRYSGIIRKVDGCGSDADLNEFWSVEFAAGRIPGAYWALLSLNSLPSSVETRIFGEVHMLSHVLGRVTHSEAGRASELKARTDDLEARLQRSSERNRQIALERDTLRTKLEEQLLVGTQRHLAYVAGNLRSRPRHVSGMLQRRDRTLIAARERARASERQVEALTNQLTRMTLLVDQRANERAPYCKAAEACVDAVKADLAKRVLYIGGRTGAIQQLRRVAAKSQSEFIHHDGGEEHALARIDGLIAGCDVVFCPVDCVSHSACLRAKQLCRKFAKPFVPLRSSGASSFERALNALT
jgi:Uncharacterized protein conserved in bacteria (DUF2325)